MGVININTIQSNISNDDVKTYTDAYVKEALSNLGQRVGAKGDSMSVDGFSLRQLLINDKNQINDLTEPHKTNSETSYLIVKKYGDDKLIIDYKGKFYQFKNFNILEASEQDSFTTLEQVEDENSISIFKHYKIINNGELGKFFTAIEYTPSSNKNEIKRILALNINNDNTVSEFIYMYIEDNILYVVTDTSISLYKSNHIVDLEKIYKTFFDEESVNAIKNAIDIVTNPDDKFANSDDNRIEDPIKESDAKDLRDKLINYWNNYLNSYINSIYNDEIFSQNYYEGLKEYLVFTVFSTYINNGGNIIIYVNDDFVFRYFINDTTKLIYYSYDFNVYRFITDVNDYINSNKLDNSDIIYVFGSGESYVDNNKIIVKYTKDKLFNTEFVESVIIDTNYILPYIKDNYWYINGEKTDISSKGADAGQPNIIIISYTAATDEQGKITTITPDVLHCSSSIDGFKEKIEENIDKDDIEPTNAGFLYNYGKTNAGNADVNMYTFNINLPDIGSIIGETHEFESLIQNCLLWTVVDTKLGSINNSTTTLAEDLNIQETSYITVFWTPSKTDGGTYNWKLLVNPKYNSDEPGKTNTVALDLGAFSSTNEITRFILNTEYNPEKYLHQYVVFNPVNKRTKNQTVDNKIAYPILSILDNDSDNITAFEPYFSDNIELNKNIINSVGDHNENKFTFGASQTKELFNGDIIPRTSLNNVIPLFNFGEVLTYNQNVLNRIDLSTLGLNTPNVYYSYIGKNHEENSPVDELTIGVYTDIAEQGILKNSKTIEYDKSKFTPHNRLNVNMPLVARNNIINKAVGNCYYIIISDTAKSIDDANCLETHLSGSIAATKYMVGFDKEVHKINLSKYLKEVLQLSNVMVSEPAGDKYLKLRSFYKDADMISIVVYLIKEGNNKFEIINANEILSTDNIVPVYNISDYTDADDDGFNDENLDFEYLSY